MQYLIIICEGQTEQEFCNEVLRPHLLNYGILVSSPIIKHSDGGIVNWRTLKGQIEQHLNESTKPFVTTIIDYYGIQSKHDFPNWIEISSANNSILSINKIYQGMLESIPQKYQSKFIPYIQLYEFESILFIDISYFERLILSKDFSDKNYLEKTIIENPNPETINNNPDTSPSKRLIKSIKGYQKTLHGNVIALEIGLENIRAKCPGFNEWVTKLEEIGKDKPK